MHKLTLGQYKDLAIPTSNNFTQKDLDKAVVESVLNAANTWDKIHNPIKNGDHITIRIVAKESGLIVPELCQNALDYVVGDSKMMPQFAEALGKKQGDTFTMEIPFAEKCPVKQVRGKVVEFEATITDVEHKEKMPIDDSLAPKLDPSCQTLAQIKEKFAIIIKANYNYGVEEQDNDIILDRIGKTSQVEFDSELFAETLEMVTEQTRKMLEGFNLPHQDQKPMEDESFHSDCKALAEKMVMDSLIIHEVALAESISISDQELAAGKKEYSHDEASQKEFEQYFPNDDAFAQFLLRNKVLEFLRTANII